MTQPTHPTRRVPGLTQPGPPDPHTHHLLARLAEAQETYLRLLREIDDLREALREAEERARRADAVVEVLMTPQPFGEWHEDQGPALWWTFPVEEPPFVGTPLDDEWPGYHTHWTPLHAPSDSKTPQHTPGIATSDPEAHGGDAP